ncbi:hypothetical protein [Achromobacter sp. B7]|uniref:hypothetical protein n=1 Tax=Achromobacter sp. B7 TaxID=2282475 RepID=UPI0013C4E074|nr:hypothetical protein [Achromobacter sp. B7]
MEILGSRRAFAFAIAASYDALTLLHLRGEWTCPQLDDVIEREGSFVQEKIALAKQSRRFLTAASDSQRAMVLSDVEDALAEKIQLPIPVSLLRGCAINTTDRKWLADLAAQCPNTDVLHRLQQLARHGASSSTLKAPDNEAAFHFIWAMGWAARGRDVDAQTALKALTTKLLQQTAAAFGLSVSGSKDALAHRLLAKIGPQGVWCTSGVAEALENVYVLREGVVPSATVLTSALEFSREYTGAVIEAFSRKSYASPDVLQSTGFIKLDTSLCRSGCPGMKIAGPYSPHQNGVPPFDFLCNCRVALDDLLLQESMEAEQVVRGDTNPAMDYGHGAIQQDLDTDIEKAVPQLTRLLEHIPQGVSAAIHISMQRLADARYEERGVILIDGDFSSGVDITLYDYRSDDGLGAMIPDTLVEAGWIKEDPGQFTNLILKKHFGPTSDWAEVAQFAATALAHTFAQRTCEQSGSRPATVLWNAGFTRLALYVG